MKISRILLSYLLALALATSTLHPANANGLASEDSLGKSSFSHVVYAKPIPDDYWKKAAIKVQRGVGKPSKKAHPIDFSASPSTIRSHATKIRKGTTQALRTWGRYLKSSPPLTVFVVHPNDREWFKARWEQIGVNGDWTQAFERPLNNGGGGAVVLDKTGVPFMWFMSDKRFTPPDHGALELYMHEVFHFYQGIDVAEGISTSGIDPCWYKEGSATFLGLSLLFPDLYSTIYNLGFAREGRMKKLRSYLVTPDGLLNKDLLTSVFLEGPKNTDECQLLEPQYGYNLGFFASERLVYDFGFEKFIEFSLNVKRSPWKDAFKSTFGVSADQWAKNVLVPTMSHVFQL